MGHASSCQSAATHQGDIRCPFCLYKTKNKNYMIDHIVLHRGESDAWQISASLSANAFNLSHGSCVFSLQRSVSSRLRRVAQSCPVTFRASSSAVINALLQVAARKTCVCTWRSTMASGPTSVGFVTSTALSWVTWRLTWAISIRWGFAAGCSVHPWNSFHFAWSKDKNILKYLELGKVEGTTDFFCVWPF